MERKNCTYNKTLVHNSTFIKSKHHQYLCHCLLFNVCTLAMKAAAEGGVEYLNHFSLAATLQFTASIPWCHLTFFLVSQVALSFSFSFSPAIIYMQLSFSGLSDKSSFLESYSCKTQMHHFITIWWHLEFAGILYSFTVYIKYIQGNIHFIKMCSVHWDGFWFWKDCQRLVQTLLHLGFNLFLPS